MVTQHVSVGLLLSDARSASLAAVGYNGATSTIRFSIVVRSTETQKTEQRFVAVDSAETGRLCLLDVGSTKRPKGKKLQRDDEGRGRVDMLEKDNAEPLENKESRIISSFSKIRAQSRQFRLLVCSTNSSTALIIALESLPTKRGPKTRTNVEYHTPESNNTATNKLYGLWILCL